MPDIDESWVRQRAHEIWEINGKPEGQDFDHWFAATEEFRARQGTKVEVAVVPDSDEASAAPKKSRKKPVTAPQAL